MQYRKPPKHRSPNAERYGLVYERKSQPGPYMLVAIDPGITTGMAFRCGDMLQTCIATSAAEVLDMLEGAHRVVIERFATGGVLSSYGLQTIELVGTVKGWCFAKGIDCRVVNPQARAPWQKQAEAQIQRHALWIHEADALAHLLGFEERNPTLGSDR